MRELLEQLDKEYEREYYAGVICEREGTSLLEHGSGPLRPTRLPD